jgi:transposase, IS5 family
MAGQPGFFDLDERYAALSAAGDPLERLAMVESTSSCFGTS